MLHKYFMNYQCYRAIRVFSVKYHKFYIFSKDDQSCIFSLINFIFAFLIFTLNWNQKPLNNKQKMMKISKFLSIYFLIFFLCGSITVTTTIASELQIDSPSAFKYDLQKDYLQLKTIIWNIRSCMNNTLITPLNFTSQLLPQGNSWKIQTSFQAKQDFYLDLMAYQVWNTTKRLRELIIEYNNPKRIVKNDILTQNQSIILGLQAGDYILRVLLKKKIPFDYPQDLGCYEVSFPIRATQQLSLK